MRLFKQSCVRSFAGCADLNLAGRAVEEGLVSQVQWRSNDDSLRPISDQQSLRHVLVTVRIAWNLGRGGTKKVQGTQWKTPQKWTVPNRTVPYHAVEKRHKCFIHTGVVTDSYTFTSKH